MNVKLLLGASRVFGNNHKEMNHNCLLCSVNFVTVYIGVLRDTFLLARIVRIKLFVPPMNETTFLSTQITKTVMSLELKNLNCC